MEHALLRTVKALVSLLMIVTMISIIVLDTLLPEHSEPDSLHGNRILERNFTPSFDHPVEVSALSSKNRKRSKAEAAKISAAKNHDAAENVEVEGELAIPLETGASKRIIPTIKSAKSPALRISTSSNKMGSLSKSSSIKKEGLFRNGFVGNRIHITRYRRSNPELASVHLDSIYDPMIKARQVRHFPYILCRGSGSIVEPIGPTTASVTPPPPPAMAAPVIKIEPTAAPVAVAPTQRPVVMVPAAAFLSSSTSVKSSRFVNLKRMVYHGSYGDISLYGKPKRLVHRFGAFGDNYISQVMDIFGKPDVGTRAPTPTNAPIIRATRAPTPLPTPRVFHRVCQDGRVIEVDGTYAPKVIANVEPTYSPITIAAWTRMPNTNGPRWSFTKNDRGRIVFDHPNIEKAIYRGTFAQVRREFRRRVDTMSPW